MDKLRDAATMALEALVDNVVGRSGRMPATHEAITALRSALAQPQDMKECRHCGWLCKPNDAPSKKGYVLEQPQGEWVDLTWDDYLELAGQARFYVADPYSGINEFCSHEFTKAAIELFKEKNKCNK